jgi:rod shape-determining protein MreC
VAAQVIGSSGSEQSRSIYIDKGTAAGVEKDMAVITADGLVGRVLRSYGSTSQVLLINDQSSGVGVILDKLRLQGVIKGTAAGEVILEKVMTDEQVALGDRIITSGGDQIFPKGITVGTVMKVSPGADLFLNIRVKPSANLSRLEEVLVITKKEDRAPSVAENNSVRAVDILTQRLPSVPDKPAADANPAANSAGTAKPGTAAPVATTSVKTAANTTAANTTAAGTPAKPAGATVKKVLPAAKPANGAPAQSGAAPAAKPGPSEDQPH